MELNDIKQTAIELMDAVKARGLAELSLDANGFKIKIKANVPAPVVYAAPSASPAAAPAAAPAAEHAQTAQPAEEETVGTKVTAPLVGTFYAAPSPEEPPYIEVGQISAPCDGTVSRIMAQSGDMVEYGQTLVVIA